MSAPIDLNKMLKDIYLQSTSEKEIEEYKVFYKTYLVNIKKRGHILSELYPISQKFYEKNLTDYTWINKEIISLKAEAKAILT